ncbi:MAG: dTDP-glucose 4,6-dehydratase [Terriglobales bacterium]|jgi:dTDP-glucose 4,6-dehydratase
MNDTILVTGGAGFIGSNFVLQWLTEEQSALVNLDKLTYAGNMKNLASVADNPRFEFVHADIADATTVHDLLSRRGVKAVVHFAAESHVDRSISGPAEFIQNNINGTFSLLEAVKRYWEDLEDKDREDFRFLHISTDEVYGSLGPEDAPFTELTAYAPNSPYAASKASSDHLVRAYHHTYGLPTLTTNCSNNYGPFQFPEKLIPLVILNALQRKSLPIYGDGRNVRDWLFVEDHCEAIRVVLRAGRPGETYNIGGVCEKTNLDVVDAICKNLDDLCPRKDGQPYSSQKAFVKDRPGHDHRYAVDSIKLQSELKWKPRETFHSGLRRTIQWYLAHGDWIRDVISGEYKTWMTAQYSARLDGLATPAAGGKG